MPINAGVAPKADVKYRGMIGYTISALISAKKLTNPKKNTFHIYNPLCNLRFMLHNSRQNRFDIAFFHRINLIGFWR